jgi:hypothetical protein
MTEHMMLQSCQQSNWKRNACSSRNPCWPNPHICCHVVLRWVQLISRHPILHDKFYLHLYTDFPMKQNILTVVYLLLYFNILRKYVKHNEIIYALALQREALSSISGWSTCHIWRTKCYWDAFPPSISSYFITITPLIFHTYTFHYHIRYVILGCWNRIKNTDEI